MPDTPMTMSHKYRATLKALNLPDDIKLPEYTTIDDMVTAILAKAITMDLINIMRRDECDVVEIPAPNHDFGTANQIIACSGMWSGFQALHFTGDTLIDCLVSAIKARQEWDAKFNGPPT